MRISAACGYRWAPTGSDRIGLSPNGAMDPPKTISTGQVQPASGDVDAYLKDMGIDLGEFAPTLKTSHDTVVWLTAEQMMSTGLANNGGLPVTVKSELTSAAPYLVLSQVDRNGEHRITLQCQPSGVTLTAYDLVGATRAREIVSHGTRSYFEIDRQETLTQQHDGASVASQSVMITRPYPATQLEHLLFARSIGAWVGGRTSAFRYGFVFQLYPVRKTLKEYYLRLVGAPHRGRSGDLGPAGTAARVGCPWFGRTTFEISFLRTDADHSSVRSGEAVGIHAMHPRIVGPDANMRFSFSSW